MSFKQKSGDSLRHPRNRYAGKYDFARLKKACPDLTPFIVKNPAGEPTIDFSNANAVKTLNRALLADFYGIKAWDIPPGYLCPPIPGRSDYIHAVADLLAAPRGGKIPTGNSTRVLDIGVGANCIYPIVGHCEYGWSFVGTDIDPLALQAAQRNIDANPSLMDHIELRAQKQNGDIFNGIFKDKEVFDLTLCNPPFHSSLEEAQAGSRRKWKNLGRESLAKSKSAPALNFGGQGAELWCPGGELAFVRRMIHESTGWGNQCLWFSSLISMEDHLAYLYTTLNNAGVTDYRTLNMAQGQKKTRVIVWTFLKPEQRENWRIERWEKRR